MMRPFLISLSLFMLSLHTVVAQEDFYRTGTIREITIHFKESNWRHLLDSLFLNTGDEGKLKGEVTIDGCVYQGAGIRYKGYSSYNADAIKNPFNIDLDYSYKYQNHLGHTKIKLSNVIHDPSFVREVLAYEIARKYLPASEANFANLYINDTLIGLYTNVEAVDRYFTTSRYDSHTNSFFKGEPVKLQYPFGQNANLALTHGLDSSGYIPYYNLESATGWNDLYRLIYTLDKGADSVSGILNIDRALWMHAFNEVLLNLDSYIGYSQNYYLYRDDNGKFNPIIWDLNMSFGSFRDSDGSYHFQGLSIPEMKRLDPMEHLSFCVSPRPLMTRLLCNDILKKIYFAHIRTIVNENFTNGSYFNRGQELQSLIDADVFRDTNRFYSYADFQANLTSTVGGTGSMILYPGLRDLMENRIAYLDSLPGMKNAPGIVEVGHIPGLPVQNEPLFITARISNATEVWLGFRFSSNGIFSRITMEDDGNHGDGMAGDSTFGAMIIPGGHTIQYYILAANDSAASLSPERAEYEFYTIQPEILPGDIVINELQAGNNGWIELLNNTTEPLNLSGMHLTDDPSDMAKWDFPDTLLGAKKYLVINTTENLKEASLTVPFNLPVAGGKLILSNSSNLALDSISYSFQVPGKSTGRYPNGFGAMALMPPTCGAYNRMGTTPLSGFSLFPNPASGSVYIETENCTGTLSVTLINTLGETVVSKVYSLPGESGSSVIRQVDLESLRSGLYFVRVSNSNETSTSKLVIK